jgi:Holliday junction resolvase
MKERQIESKVVKKAKELGFLTYKFSSPSNRGVPDRIFISSHGEVFFIEFKSAKGKVTKLQEKTIKDICNYGVGVFIINSVEVGLQILTLLKGSLVEC